MSLNRERCARDLPHHSGDSARENALAILLWTSGQPQGTSYFSVQTIGNRMRKQRDYELAANRAFPGRQALVTGPTFPTPYESTARGSPSVDDSKSCCPAISALEAANFVGSLLRLFRHVCRLFRCRFEKLTRSRLGGCAAPPEPAKTAP